MKNLLLIITLLGAAPFAYAQSFTQTFTGNFIDGTLNGYTIDGSFEIDTLGQSSGTAYVSGFGPEILAFTFEIFDTNSSPFSDFIETDDLDALATFDTIAPATDPQVTTFDYFGENFNGEFLDFFYDAYAADPSTAFAVSYDDGSGDVSNATLNLATGVPEPGAFAGIAGLLALIAVATRRRIVN